MARSGPGRLAALPIILAGVLLAGWLLFDAAFDQRSSPHTTIVTLAGAAALLGVIATLGSLLGWWSRACLRIPVTGFGGAAVLSLTGHARLVFRAGAPSLLVGIRQFGALLAIAGPPLLAGLIRALGCAWLARTTH